jgi:hypothetical protein
MRHKRVTWAVISAFALTGGGAALADAGRAQAEGKSRAANRSTQSAAVPDSKPKHASEQWNWQAGAPSQWVRERSRLQGDGMQQNSGERRRDQQDYRPGRSAMGMRESMPLPGGDFRSAEDYRHDPRGWDAMGEFDRGAFDRRGRRMQRSPEFWSDVDEGFGYTYRDRYYDDAPQRYDRRAWSDGPGGRYSDGRYGEYGPQWDDHRPRTRYGDDARYRDERMARYPPSDPYAEYDRWRGRGMSDRLSPGRGNWREGPAVGPQGWRGDLGDALSSDQQASMYDDRGVTGPQGWQPGMNESPRGRWMQGQ